jgi:hypothetical protein
MCPLGTEQEQYGIVLDLLKAFLGKGSVNMVNVEQWKMCLNGPMLLRTSRCTAHPDAGSESCDLFSVWFSLCSSITGFSVQGPCKGYITRSTE